MNYVLQSLKNKKGQITMFVIMGLVVFSIIFIGLYLIQQAEIEDVPEETIVYDDARLNPVYQDVESCVYQLTKEAVNEIGSGGGYINSNSQSYIFNQEPAYINTAVELFEDSGLVVPYWYGIRGGPRCTECSYYINRPSLTGDEPNSIQNQIERYVENNLVSCTNALIRHENNFDVDIKNSPEVSVQFLSSNTKISVDWPITLEVLGEDTIFNINYFESEVDVNLRDTYDIASDVLVQLIMNGGVLDEYAISVSNAAAMGGIQGDIPPRAGGTVYDGEMFNFWLLSDVREVLRYEIADQIHYLQVIGSRDSHIIGNLEDSNLEAFISGFSHNIFGPNDNLANMKISFDYFPTWPLYVGVNPSRGEFIMPKEEVSINLPMVRMSMSTYDFTYDLTFPVLITIEDVNAFDGEGFTLMFASEANIRHSQRYSDDIIIDDMNEEDAATGFLDPNARTIPVRVNVQNEFGAPVEGIVVDYNCMDESITIGSTETVDGNAVIDSLLPTCVGGRFNTVGMEYYSDSLEASILEDESNEYTITVYQEKEVNVLLGPRNVIPLNYDCDVYDDTECFVENWTLASEDMTTLASEDIVLVMNRLVNGQETEYVKAIEISAGDFETKTIDLVPGEYTLFLQSTSDRDEDFKTRNVTAHDPSLIEGWLTGETDPVIIEGVNLNNTLIKGFLHFDNVNPIVITEEDINKGSIKISYPRIVYDDIIRFTPDLDALGYMMDLPDEQKEDLTPRFTD